MTDVTHDTVQDAHMDWYVRRGSAVQGPYAARQISRYLLLGRVRQTDRVSVDGENWQALSELPHLIPDEMKDLESEQGRARFLQAHLRADERGGDRAGEEEATMPGWRGRKDRRHYAVNDEFDYIRQIAARYMGSGGGGRLHPVLVVGALMIAALTGGLLLSVVFDFGRPQLAGAQCSVSPHARVNWAYCVKDGLSLSGIDLREASLRYVSMRDTDLSGAQLRGADLAFGKLGTADLSRADLSYAMLAGADFSNARLNGANLAGADLTQANFTGADVSAVTLDGARLDAAVWTNGQVCLQGSVGHCRQ